MQTNADTEVYGIKANGILAVGPGDLKTGIDYYNRNWNATNVRMMYMNFQPVSMIPDVYINNLGLFGEYTVPFADKFKLVAGVRGDLTWAEAETYNGYVTPFNNSTDFQSIGANVQLTYIPVTGLETYLGLGRGTRTPDPQELYLNLPGNPASRGNAGLKATVNNQVDVGIKYSRDTFYVNGSFFYSALSDYINYFAASPTLKSYQNVAATMLGYEFGSQVSLPYDLFLKGSLSYTWGNNNDYHKPLSEIPPLRGSIGIRYDNSTFFFEATENLSSRQNRVDLGLGETPTAGYVTTDLKAGYKYKDLSVIAGISNLFDIQYYNYLSYLRDPFATGVKVPENGRNFYVTVQFKI
jgi:iron complex outermembrane recepter protein